MLGDRDLSINLSYFDVLLVLLGSESQSFILRQLGIGWKLNSCQLLSWQLSVLSFFIVKMNLAPPQNSYSTSYALPGNWCPLSLHIEFQILDPALLQPRTIETTPSSLSRLYSILLPKIYARTHIAAKKIAFLNLASPSFCPFAFAGHVYVFCMDKNMRRCKRCKWPRQRGDENTIWSRVIILPGTRF